MRAGVAAGVLAVLVGAASAAPAPASVPANAKLDALIAKTIADGHLLGLAVAIVDHGKVVIEQGYGFTDLDRKTAITADTIFEIGSLSKQFTAVAILRLVDTGKLKLSDRVATYLPAITGDITIQQLLWQTAGLTEYAWGINIGKTPAELIKLIGAMPRAFPTGTKWAYSNSNYYVLGEVVAVVSKQPFADYLRDQVIARAGLTATRMCAPDTAQARPTKVTAGLAGKGRALDPAFFGGAGGVCSSARDLLRWQDALFGGKVLSAESLAVLTTNGKLGDGTAINYASGLIADQIARHAHIWHNGAIPGGYESQLGWFPDDKLQIVLLTNTENTPAGQIFGALERSLAVEQLRATFPAPLDKPLSAAELARYVGRFRVGKVTANIAIDGTHLHVAVDPAGLDAKLLYQGGDRFAVEDHPGVDYRFALADKAAHASAIEVWRDDKKLVTLARSAD